MSATIQENLSVFLAPFKQKKLLQKAAEDAGDERRIIEGYANFKVIDRIGDLIDPAAFTESIPTYMLNPQLRFNHEEGTSIGKVTQIEVREDGLWIQAEIGNWPLANEKWEQIKFGSLKTFSIMGRVLDWQYRKDEVTGREYTYITKFELVEISVVEIPMNQLSVFEKKTAKAEQFKKRLISTFERRMKNMTEQETQTPQEEDVQKDVEEVTPPVDETVEEPIQKDGDAEDGNATEDVDMQESLKTISEFVEQVSEKVLAFEETIKGFDDRLKSLEEKMNPSDEGDDTAEEEDSDEEKSLSELDTLKKVMTEVLDEKLKSLNLIPEEEEEKKKSVRKTGTKREEYRSVEDEVNALAKAIKERMLS